MNELIKQIQEARFIWVCGNGGSAATAEHFTTDLIKKGYPAICLNSNTSMMTMIANDYGYERVFSWQLAAYGHAQDLLVTVSCSGKSKNIKNVLKVANNKGMAVYKFETFKKDKDFGLLENKHLQFVHEVASQL